MGDGGGWVAFAANGAGAAVGAIVAGILTYFASRSLARQQIRQAKLEECLTLSRNIKTSARSMISPNVLNLLLGNRDGARQRLASVDVSQLTEWSNDLATLIEVHAPEMEETAHSLHLQCKRLHMLVRKAVSNDKRFDHEQATREIGQDMNGFLNDVCRLADSIRPALIDDARMTGWVKRTCRKMKR